MILIFLSFPSFCSRIYWYLLKVFYINLNENLIMAVDLSVDISVTKDKAVI